MPFILQVSLYAYTTGFTMVNGNASYVSVLKPRRDVIWGYFFWRLFPLSVCVV